MPVLWQIPSQARVMPFNLPSMSAKYARRQRDLHFTDEVTEAGKTDVKHVRARTAGQVQSQALN